VLVPPPLRPGHTLRVVAPAGPADRTLLFRGLGWLAQRYRVRFSPTLLCREGYFAGSDAERLADLQDAMDATDVHAVVAARGGYGLGRIAHELDFTVMRTHPRWLVGFSDITALHVETGRAGIASLHANNCCGLGRGDHLARQAWLEALEAQNPGRRFEGLDIWVPGRSRGPLVGGNLTVLAACATAGRLDLPEGCVLFLEDVAEAPYRLDRALTSLCVGGHLNRVSAVVCGEFTDCPAGRHGVAAHDAIRGALAPLRVPVLAGLPAGHGRANVPLHLGFTATVDATRGTLKVEPP
jgi:muramoyltetrapeptide carboxypeptidase